MSLQNPGDNFLETHRTLARPPTVFNVNLTAASERGENCSAHCLRPPPLIAAPTRTDYIIGVVGGSWERTRPPPARYTLRPRKGNRYAAEFPRRGVAADTRVHMLVEVLDPAEPPCMAPVRGPCCWCLRPAWPSDRSSRFAPGFSSPGPARGSAPRPSRTGLHAWLGGNSHTGGGGPPARADPVRSGPTTAFSGCWCRSQATARHGSAAPGCRRSWVPLLTKRRTGSICWSRWSASSSLARRAIGARRQNSRVGRCRHPRRSLAAGLGMAVRNASQLLDDFCAAGIAVEVTHRSKRRPFGLTDLATLRDVVRPPTGRSRGADAAELGFMSAWARDG
jgi:hypothetical protein